MQANGQQEKAVTDTRKYDFDQSEHKVPFALLCLSPFYIYLFSGLRVAT